MQEAIVYCRTSTMQQATRHSLERQLESCFSYCHKQDMTIAGVFSDICSGLATDKLTGRKQAMAMAKKRRAVVVVESLDRFSRELFRDCPYLQELKSGKVRRVFLTQPDYAIARAVLGERMVRFHDLLAHDQIDEQTAELFLSQMREDYVEAVRRVDVLAEITLEHCRVIKGMALSGNYIELFSG